MMVLQVRKRKKNYFSLSEIFVCCYCFVFLTKNQIKYYFLKKKPHTVKAHRSKQLFQLFKFYMCYKCVCFIYVRMFTLLLPTFFLRQSTNYFLSKLTLLPWFQIQIGPKSWIRIQIKCIWIHNTAYMNSMSPRSYTISLWVKYRLF